jgi:hypothetical protein
MDIQYHEMKKLEITQLQIIENLQCSLEIISIHYKWTKLTYA